MAFLDLPNEVVLLVVTHLEYAYETNALCCTSRRLRELLNPVLYKHSLTQQNGGFTLEWAAINGLVSTTRLILEAGAPPDALGGMEQAFALAAIHGHSEIIGLLYEHGVDPCTTEKDRKHHLDEPHDLDCEEGHPLSMAAAHGHVSVVSLLLEYGVPVDLHTATREKRTALHLAAEKGHLDVLRVLVDAGSQIDAQDYVGTTPLHFAVHEGHLEAVQFLLACGADPNMPTTSGSTALCMAPRSGNIDVVRCLLDHEAMTNPCCPAGGNPLWQLAQAAERGYDDIVDLLLTRFDYIQLCAEPYQQSILLCVAALTGRTALLSDLLSEHNYNSNMGVSDEYMSLPCKCLCSTPASALTWAAERNQAAAIDILMSHGASLTTPSNEKSVPLLHAIRNGHKEATAALLAHGINPNAPPGKALFSAIPHPSIFSLLLSHGADPTIPVPCSNLLADILTSGNADTLRILLDHPRGTSMVTDPIIKGPMISLTRPEEVPLIRLAIQGGEEVLRLLLDRNLLAPPEHLQDRTASQYLILAAQHGKVSLMALLLDMGFDVHAGDNAGALVNAAAKAQGDPDGLLDFLLENGCSVHDTDYVGHPALFLAAKEKDETAMRRLLRRGADPLVGRWGETVLPVVVGNGLFDAVRDILGVLDERQVGSKEVEGVLKRAEERALKGGCGVRDHHGVLVPRGSFFNNVKALRRFYWLRKYPVCT
ncbi:uncharacterized protein APUU_40216A [Aspergillus puulaauensis]|uniref:Ankyrin repeat-containing domain protein n=1 Tax=Aspergillus puulaauensis TaxID=1220207 RepID=A0A7R8AMG8_9EURO|nr:uncharacterized protein APUU_40216A [Aspergillus puulaauensis]BCS23772.1 hypothetical protein APUU_40216A [Aspergillus puulaauensis]